MNRSKDRLHSAAAVVDEQALIAVSVLEKSRHLFGNVDLVPFKIAITHQALSTADSISFRLETLRLQVEVAKRLVRQVFWRARTHVLKPADFGRWIDMIQRGHGAAKTVGAKKLFGIESAVRFSELNVVLFGKAA
jgi:hypothetical protein